ncbi:hypothetical protein GCM10020218_058010 [Dactylosporangium vinaceum]
MERKNWRRKNTANGVMSRLGATMPKNVSMAPRLFTSVKLGSSVKMGGTIRAAMMMPKTRSRPGKRRRAKAYPAIAQQKVWTPAMSAL